jgi:coenzyme PQQ synthesis protein D (PqqD)
MRKDAPHVDSAQIYRLSENVTTATIEGELIVLDLEGDDYFGLNEVGSAIWEMVAHGMSLSEMQDRLTGTYAVDSIQAEDDLRSFLHSLADAHLIEPVTDSEPA